MRKEWAGRECLHCKFINAESVLIEEMAENKER